MKTLITIMFVLLVSMQSYGQRKGKVDPKDLQIDSLTQVSAAQAMQLDSVSAELEKYLGVYISLVDKVFKYYFDPAKTSFLIDSLRTSRDSTFQLANDVLEDSLAIMRNNNIALQATLDSLGQGTDPVNDMALEEQEKEAAIKDLKDLKELLDTGIITQQEFDLKKQKLLEKL
jgi:hypothetical protein